MRRIGPIIALSLLVPAAPAAAKGVASATICGPSDCRQVKDHAELAALEQAGPPTEAPTRAAPWFRATLIMRGGDRTERVSLVVVPKLQRLRAEDGTWLSVLPAAAPAYPAMVAGLDPFPASKLEVGRPELRPVSPAARIGDGGGGDGGIDAAWMGAGAGALLLAGAGSLGLRRRRRRG